MNDGAGGGNLPHIQILCLQSHVLHGVAPRVDGKGSNPYTLQEKRELHTDHTDQNPYVNIGTIK